MAVHEPTVRGTDVMGGRHIDGDLRRHHRLRAPVGSLDASIRPGRGDGDQCRTDRRGAARILIRAELLDSACNRHTVWSRGWGSGRRIEQLCRPALRESAYELAALHVGARRYRRSVYHGLRAIPRSRLALGVPVYRHCPDRVDRNYRAQPAVVEEQAKQHEGQYVFRYG